MKLWESEMFVMNLETGVMARQVSQHVFSGVNFEQAQLSLVRSGLKHLQLTGNWFWENQQPMLPAVSDQYDDLNKAYEDLIDPVELTNGMTMDEFIDWLNISDNVEDIQATMAAFVKAGLTDHVKVIVGHLKHKYGYKKNQEGLQQSDERQDEEEER